MRRWSWVAPALATSLMLGAGPAFADVFVAVDVFKRKDIDIVERIEIAKAVTVSAFFAGAVEKAAESDVIVDQVNLGNQACTNCDEKTDTLVNSGNSNSGVLSINQAAGNMNNQGNVVSAAVDAVVGNGGGTPPTPSDPTGVANSQSALEQENGVFVKFAFDVTVTPARPLDERFESDVDFTNLFIVANGNTVTTVDIIFRDATLQNAVNGNSGIAQVNQSPGNMNNQANSLSLAVSLAGNGVALAEADLGQINAVNQVFESDVVGSSIGVNGDDVPAAVGINKNATITGSILGNTGIVGVNQSAGNMANQANNVSFAAVTPGN
ncbi:MAG: hypothetical protein HYZ11_06060 [Candidatus Tectomicrobia bacterium]|uniref:Uncharacterized protein n=1 Tax=Tectimicrobiota bacterium TaxID=2528274 RepID=A0A932HY27_UNCTE|nr:hypothetical protein [Candidatus Tectomicrobia bacterium]